MFNLPIFRNERDVEIGLLYSFLDKNDSRFGSVLDVGCSHAAYLELVRGISGQLEGIDLTRDDQAVKNLDHFYQGDFLTADLPLFDFVVSISTIEHVGVEYLPSKLYQELQQEFLAKIIRLMKKAAFITFPCGEDILFPGRYFQAGPIQFKAYEEVLRSTKYQKSFYSTPDPTDPSGWRQVPQDLAMRSTGELSRGVDTICVLEVYR